MSMTKAGCALTLFFLVKLSWAQGTAQAISYVGRQLKIDASNMTLSDVLTQVAAVTGVKIDFPAGVSNERIPVIKYGPASARQVLASLLSGADVNFLIKDSDSDPEKVQSVLILPGEKGSTKGGPDTAMPSYLSAEARVAKQHEETETVAASGSLVTPASGENTAPVDNHAAASPLPAPVAEAAAAEPPSSGQPERLNGLRIAPQSPPPVMNQQNMNQQLQQMYQQRVQIVQQDRPVATPSAGHP